MNSHARILVVEDNPSLAEVIELQLAARNLNVTVVNDGLDAWRAFETEAPALVTLDLNIPTISGYRLVTLFKRFHPDVPILVVTALDFAEAEEVARAGVDDFLTKPFDPNVLAAKVQFLLQRARQDAAGTTLRSDPITTESTTRVGVALAI